jgi:hypothetical protein
MRLTSTYSICWRINLASVCPKKYCIINEMEERIFKRSIILPKLGDLFELRLWHSNYLFCFWEGTWKSEEWGHDFCWQLHYTCNRNSKQLYSYTWPEVFYILCVMLIVPKSKDKNLNRSHNTLWSYKHYNDRQQKVKLNMGCSHS